MPWTLTMSPGTSLPTEIARTEGRPAAQGGGPPGVGGRWGSAPPPPRAGWLPGPAPGRRDPPPPAPPRAVGPAVPAVAVVAVTAGRTVPAHPLQRSREALLERR